MNCMSVTKTNSKTYIIQKDARKKGRSITGGVVGPFVKN